jgi:DNA-binding response OmpR family regulator
MVTASYKGVEVVLAEPHVGIGEAVSKSLIRRGARDVVICRDVKALIDTLELRSVDILLCDVALNGIRFRETMQRIRRREVGMNPFVQIIATIGESGRKQAREVIGSGVDDVIRQPMPPDKILARFEQLVRPRRPFAVTESYIGPNRRKKQRPGDAMILVHVPNTLRLKLIDQLPRYTIQERIQGTSREISERSERTRPQAIGALSDRILAFYAGKGSEEELMRDIRYLLEKSEELIQRCEASGAAHIQELAASMRGVTRRIVTARKKGDKKTIKLMPNLSRAAHKSMATPDEAVGTVREIAKVVRDFLEERG